MIDLESIDHIYLFPGSTDLRKGRHSLALLARRIHSDDGLHELFLFCNRKNELIKIYEKDSTGVWVYIRSLDETRFPWPNSIADLSSTILHATKKWNYHVRIFSLTVSSHVLNVFDIKKP